MSTCGCLHAGVKCLLEDEAVVVGGSNHSHATADLYDSIAAGDYPEWKLLIQARQLPCPPRCCLVDRVTGDYPELKVVLLGDVFSQGLYYVMMYIAEQALVFRQAHHGYKSMDTAVLEHHVLSLRRRWTRAMRTSSTLTRWTSPRSGRSTCSRCSPWAAWC